MTLPPLRRLAAAATLLLLGPLPILAAEGQPAAPAKETGELWEVISQMSMEGAPMALPSHKMQVCASKEWKEPPGGMDERQKCKATDFKLAGQVATWKVTCAGPPAMSGEGKITRTGPGDYNGQIKFKSDEANLTVKLTGHKLGPCDLPTN